MIGKNKQENTRTSNKNSDVKMSWTNETIYGDFKSIYI